MDQTRVDAEGSAPAWFGRGCRVSGFVQQNLSAKWLTNLTPANLLNSHHSPAALLIWRHLGAQLGITAVLHTWTRQLLYHPHLHCIVTAGGLSADGQQWIHKDQRFLFPVRALAKVFRGKFLQGLRALLQQGALTLTGACAALREAPAIEVLFKQLMDTAWVVYAKRPFGGTKQIFAYLGRYTHRVGLSNHRLVSIDQQQVRFKTKHGKTCTVSKVEFIRRFLLHILPSGFTKIRHYGLLSASGTRSRLPKARCLLQAAAQALPPQRGTTSQPLPGAQPPPVSGRVPDRLQAPTPIDPLACPHCQRGRMRCVAWLHRSGFIEWLVWSGPDRGSCTERRADSS